MRCNSCGKLIRIENNIIREDVFEAVKEWGYFSKKDLEIHKFNLCEECYDKITSSFIIPVEINSKNEVMGL